MTTANLMLYVVDDDEAVRRSMAMLLISRGLAVQVFDSGEAFLAGADLRRHGCVVLDREMGTMSGVQVFHALRERGSQLVVLFVSGHGDIPSAREVVQNGAIDWLEKPCSDTVLMGKIGQALERAAALAALEPLKALWEMQTPREKEVARCARTGHSSKQVARDMTAQDPTRPIDPRTVDTHLGTVYAKLGIAGRSELDAFMRKIGV